MEHDCILRELRVWGCMTEREHEECDVDLEYAFAQNVTGWAVFGNRGYDWIHGS